MSQSDPKQLKHSSWIWIGLLPLGVLALLGWLVVHLGESRGHRSDLAQEVSEAEQLQGQLLLLDEVLSMSARLYAQTGEESWKERHDASVGELRRVITGVLAHSTDELATRFERSALAASTELRSSALQSFALVRLGQSERGYQLLTNGAYDHAKNRFRDGVLEHGTGLSYHHAERLESIVAVDRGLAFLACITLLMIAGLGAYSMRLAMKGIGYRASLADARREHEALLAALDCAPDGVLIVDRKAIITFVNEAYCRLSGYPREVLLGASATILKSKETLDEVYEELWSSLKRGDEWSGRILNRRCIGPNQFEDHWSYLHFSQLIDRETERSTGFIGIQRDISVEIRAESESELREASSAGLMRVSRKLDGPGTIDERLEAALRALTACKGFREDLGAAVLHLGDGENELPLMLASCGGFERFGSIECLTDEGPISQGETRRRQIFMGLCDDILPADELAGYVLLSFDEGSGAQGMLVVGCEGRMAGDPVFAEIIESATALFSNTTLQAKMRLELESAVEEANRANRSKSEFLATMSHEIRTPMTSIVGYSDLLLDSNRSPEDQEQAGLVIRQCAQELMGLIDGLIDISSVEAGILQANYELASPVEIATHVVRELLPSAEAKGIRLALDVEGLTPSSIRTDPGRLRQILLNLVGNAIKFTEIGSVTLRMRLASHESTADLLFEIVDTGIGVTEEQQRSLFCAFQQADRSIGRRFGGTGLGLTICRAFAKLLKAEILIDSTVSVGSTFTLRLPVGEVQELNLTTWEGLQGQAPGIQQGKQPDHVLSYRLLLAEDDVVNQLVVTKILEKAGATVDTVSDGEQAIERVIESAGQGVPYDAVLMDLTMPVMDGLTATRVLRENKMTLPIIALTADARPSTRKECMEAGCDGCTVKPVDREELFSLLVDRIGKGSACHPTPAQE